MLDMQGMIVSKPANIKYLTGIQAEGLLLVTRKENIFLTYTMFLESVKSTLTKNDEIVEKLTFSISVKTFKKIVKETRLQSKQFLIIKEHVNHVESMLMV